MADQTEDISSFEDIGQRLDDLLDALKVSAEEVAETGANLGKSLDEIAAAQLTIDANAIIDDSGAVSSTKKKAENAPDSEGSAEPDAESDSEIASESEPEAELETEHESEVAEADQAPEPEQPTDADAVAEAAPESDETEPAVAAEPEIESDLAPEAAGSTESGPDSEVDVLPEVEQDPQTAAIDDQADDVSGASPAVEEPAAESAPEPEPEPIAESSPTPTLDGEEASEADAGEDETALIDDGLLIEPEAQAKPDDIDGAPAGPSNLENELDEELDALLASGMFEDPLAEIGTDESATPVDLPDEAEPSVEAEPEAAESGERKPNLPTDEAELIGELDEQLAALADAELDAVDEAEPAPEVPAASAGADEPAQPSEEPTQEQAQVTEPEREAQPEPVAVATKPAPASGWKAAMARTYERTKPVAERSWQRTQSAVIGGATRANAPLKDKPVLKQVVGWVALVHVFYAACLWSYVALWHNPPAPPPETPQPTLEAPATP